MREDCTHYETRTYDDGEVARFCTKDLAPEAPWRCPDDCPGYEHIQFITGDFEKGSLGKAPRVEDEPEGDGIAELLDDAEDIVNGAAPDIIAELDRGTGKKRRWWQRRGRGDGDEGEFRFSSR
jgi:hypothetical protein